MTGTPPQPVSDPQATGIGPALQAVFATDARALQRTLDAVQLAGDDAALRTLIRLALQQPDRTTMWYQRLVQRWEDLGAPGLKPNAIARRMEVLSNHTVDNLVPLVRGMSASFGIDLTVHIGAYDSVELEAFQPTSTVHADDIDYVAVVLSAHWLQRYLGESFLIERSRLDQAKSALEKIVAALLTHGQSHVLVTTFPPPGHGCPGSMISSGDHLGLGVAIAELNLHLAAMQNDRMSVVDLAQAVHLAGGAAAYNPTNYVRAKMPYETAGFITLARELAAAVVSLSGKAHRALVTDLDNTIWGGVLGELGPHGVRSSHDDPDGLSYYQLQTYLKGLTASGTLLTVASKNSQENDVVFDDNPNVALARSDFSIIKMNWEPKSRSIAAIAAGLGFGAEYMVFLDDNLFELAEALGQHPDLDVVLADEDPLCTIESLSRARFFHTQSVTDADLARGGQIKAKQESAEFATSFDDYDEYLKAIKIALTVEPCTPENQARVLQLLQKSNQFNLTTRRHTESQLDDLRQRGATIGVFSYADSFGPQGVIAVVILLPEENELQIESWVMSCRVLNRTVEHAIARWAIEQAEGRALVGRYDKTDKNGLVRDLYSRLGFVTPDDPAADSVHWRFDPQPDSPRPHTHAKLTALP